MTTTTSNLSKPCCLTLWGRFKSKKASVANLHQYKLPFGYDWSLGALGYGKLAGDLLLVRPRVIGVKVIGFLETKKPRNIPSNSKGRSVIPTRLNSGSCGYVVDELPPPVDVEYSFAS